MALNRLNLTTSDELCKINNIGEKLAERICNDRPFESFEDLKNIRGVDPNKRKAIQKYFSNSGFDKYISCEDLQNRDIGSDKLLILHVNAGSLQNKEIIGKLRNLIDPLSHKPDVICVSESRNLTDEEASLDGYIFECKPNENNPSSVGGVAIYIKDSIKIHWRRNLIFDIQGCESIWLNITWNSKSYVIGAIYRHPETKSAYKNEFKNSFKVAIQKFKKIKDVFYILGDFNLDLLDDNDNFIKNYRDMLKNLGAVQLIHAATRVTESSSMLLDHIVTNDHATSGKISGIIKTDCISDHYPVYVIKQQIPH